MYCMFIWRRDNEIMNVSSFFTMARIPHGCSYISLRVLLSLWCVRMELHYVCVLYLREQISEEQNQTLQDPCNFLGRLRLFEHTNFRWAQWNSFPHFKFTKRRTHYVVSSVLVSCHQQYSNGVNNRTVVLMWLSSISFKLET